jgi:hypothetical protein
MVKKYLSIFLFLAVGCIQSESLNNDMDSVVNDEFTSADEVASEEDVVDIENNALEDGLIAENQNVIDQLVQGNSRDEELARRTEAEVLRAKFAHSLILKAREFEDLRRLEEEKLQEEARLEKVEEERLLLEEQRVLRARQLIFRLMQQKAQIAARKKV